MQSDICLYPWDRERILEQISAYRREMKARVFPVFKSIDQEATNRMNEMISHHSEHIDSIDGGFSLMEAAHEEGYYLYCELSFVKYSIIKVAILGIYHMHEKYVKKIIKHFMREQRLDHSIIEKFDSVKVENFLSNHGYRYKENEFGNSMTELIHISNASKHGEGRSCRELFKMNRNLFSIFQEEFSAEPYCGYEPQEEDIEPEIEDFDRYADAVEAFWRAFPGYENGGERDTPGIA